MRSFTQMAKLVKYSREKAKLSQSELSKKLGYKNGQFVSNVERGLCSVPMKNAFLLCGALHISHLDFRTAWLKDQEKTININVPDITDPSFEPIQEVLDDTFVQ